MNEQVKQLMEQAFQEHYGNAVTPGARKAALELVSGWGEKFAELIIEKVSYDLMDVGGSNHDGIFFVAKQYGVDL